MAAWRCFGVIDGYMEIPCQTDTILCQHVHKKVESQNTVQEAPTDGTWIQDIRGGLAMQILLEYL